MGSTKRGNRQSKAQLGSISKGLVDFQWLRCHIRDYERCHVPDPSLPFHSFLLWAITSFSPPALQKWNEGHRGVSQHGCFCPGIPVNQSPVTCPWTSLIPDSTSLKLGRPFAAEPPLAFLGHCPHLQLPSIPGPLTSSLPPSELGFVFIYPFPGFTALKGNCCSFHLPSWNQKSTLQIIKVFCFFPPRVLKTMIKPFPLRPRVSSIFCCTHTTVWACQLTGHLLISTSTHWLRTLQNPPGNPRHCANAEGWLCAIGSEWILGVFWGAGESPFKAPPPLQADPFPFLVFGFYPVCFCSGWANK